MSPWPFLLVSEVGIPHLAIRDLSALAPLSLISLTIGSGNKDSPQIEELISLSGSCFTVAEAKTTFLHVLLASPHQKRALAKDKECVFAIKRKAS